MKLDTAEKIARFSIDNVGRFDSVNISTACSRLAKLMHCDTFGQRNDSDSPASRSGRDRVAEAIKALSMQAMKLISTFQGRAVASLLSALSALKEEPEPQLIAALSRRAIELAGSFSPQSLTTLLSACTTLAVGEMMAELVGAMMARAAATADMFGPQDIANLMQVLVKVGVTPGSEADRLVMTMSKRARATAPDFKPRNAATLVWALKILGAPPIAELDTIRSSKREVAAAQGYFRGWQR